MIIVERMRRYTLHGIVAFSSKTRYRRKILKKAAHDAQIHHDTLALMIPTLLTTALM